MKARAPELLLALVAAIAVVAALGSIGKVASQTIDRARDDELERDLAPTQLARVDPRAFLVADRVFGPHDTYTVITGERIPGVPQIALDGAPQFAAYWLLPRRYVYPPGKGRWVISYGGNLAELAGVRFSRHIPVSRGVVLAEVAR